MKYDGRNLAAILAAHKAWLAGEGGGTYANLQDANLQYANLQYANLQDANLQYANLQDANLQYANLQGANLQDAKLQGANLQDANLQDAKLQYAKLQDANLQGANLQYANLQDAKLQYANLQYAKLQGANLQDAKLQDAKLQGANLQYAKLQDANLQDANLQGAKLQDAKLQDANLQYAKLQDANLSEIDSARLSIVPQGELNVWKSCRNGTLVNLLIPKEARRSNATGRKCRAEFADVIKVIGSEIGQSKNPSGNGTVIEYRKGQRVTADSWDECRWNECSHGIHFYLTKEEAEAIYETVTTPANESESRTMQRWRACDREAR